MLRGEFIPPTRAHELGVVDEIFPKQDFLAATIEYARDAVRRLPRAPAPTAPQTPWRRPSNLLAAYRRQGGVGIITLSEECGAAGSLQVLWALNRAILAARLDDGVEAILLTHHGAELKLGAEASVDERTWDYAEFVFSRLENFPRLCVLAFHGGLDRLATELALACDYRLAPARATGNDVILTIPTGSRRHGRYFPRTGTPLTDVPITFAQAQAHGLIESAETSSWPEPMLTWMARFVSPRGASKAIGYAKLAVVKGSALPHEAGMLLERHLQEQLFRGHDGPEGMRAYLEKRSAVFTGE
jgi:enoyl-CoA hydratase/carnithine racemase